MEFKDFLMACKFSKVGIDNGNSELTCRRKDRIPQNDSWGICDEQHCPYYGVRAANAKMYVDGVIVATAGEVRYVLDSGEVRTGRTDRLTVLGPDRR